MHTSHRVWIVPATPWTPPLPLELPAPDPPWVDVTSWLHSLDPRQGAHIDLIADQTVKPWEEIRGKFYSRAALVLPTPLAIRLIERSSGYTQDYAVTGWDMALEVPTGWHAPGQGWQRVYRLTGRDPLPDLITVADMLAQMLDAALP